MASKIRASIKTLLMPAMEQAGFVARYPHFQRKQGGRLELVNVERDKWGGGFFLEFATLDAGDLHTSWGDIVAEAEIEVAYTDPSTRARLMASVGSAPSGYFRYESFADQRELCDDLVKEVVRLLPQVLAWFERGIVGPNIAPFSDG